MTAKTQSSVKEYNLVQILQVPPKKVTKFLVKRLGQKVKKGELVAEKKGLLKKLKFFAPVEGILTSLTEEGVLRIKTLAEKKIEPKLHPPKQATEIKGKWGKGSQALGELFCLEQKAAIFNLKGEHQDQILALNGKLNQGLWHKAKSIGIRGIICGGLPDNEFGNQIEKEVLLVDGEERGIAIPLVILGERGEIPQDTWQVLKNNQGKKIFIEGDGKKVLIPQKRDENQIKS